MKVNLGELNRFHYFLTEPLMPISAPVDVTADANFLTDSAASKHVILSKAKQNIRYQTENDGRGMQCFTIARLPIFVM